MPLGVLFQRPTVAHLAELVARPDVGEAASSLVPIQPRGARPPLFCVHPAGGTVFCYRELAAALGDDQPLYGLQAQGVDGLLAPHARIEEMAAHYLRALRSVQPAGPYRLAGWSLGGNIAYEMACQLSEASEEVALVALFDAGAIPPERERNEEDFLTMLLGLFSAEDRLSLERLRELSPEEQLAYFVDRARQADLVAMPGASAAGAQHVFDVFQANLQAVVDHVPRQYTGRVTLLKAAVQSGDLCDDPLLGWGTHAAGGVELHVIPGDHVHMLAPPSVRSVAECLALALRKSVVPTLVD